MGRAQALVGDAIPGLVVLGSLRKRVEETDQRVGNWFPYNMGRLCGLLVFAKIEISTQSVLPRLGSLEPTVDLPMLPLG